MTHIRVSRPYRDGNGVPTPPATRSPPLSDRFPVLRLVSLSLVLCLAPLALLTYFTIHLAHQAVVKEVNARVRTTSAVTAVLLNAQMQSVVGFTSSYASRQLLIAALADGTPANFDEAVIARQLAQLAPPGSGGAFLTDAACRLTHVLPATPEIIGTDFAFRDWCKGVTATGQPYVSEAYRTSMAGNRLVVAVVAPVRALGDDSSALLGILGVVYPVDSIREFADDLAHAQGLLLTITDQRGTLLAGRTASGDAQGLVSGLADTRVQEALAGHSGSMRSVGVDGDAISGFAPVAGIGWTVSAEVSAREALVGVYRLRETVLAVAAIIGVVMLAGVVLLARALRQRREAERSLTEREASTRAILAAATEAFISMDASGKIIAWNRQAEVVYGWTEAEALGRQLAETILPPEMREAQNRGLAEFVATGTGFAVPLNERFEAPGLHKDGHWFMTDVGIWAVRTARLVGASTRSCRTSPSASWPRPPWRRPGTRHWPRRSSSRSSWPT